MRALLTPFRGSVLRLAALPLAATVWSWSVPSALSYCRTTTCNPSIEDCTPPEGSSCTEAGLPLAWSGRCLGFSVSRDSGPDVPIPHDTLAETSRLAFDAWLSVDCPGGAPGIVVRELEPVGCAAAEFNPAAGNANVIAFRHEDWPYDEHALGLTTVTFRRSTGEILDADIEINAADYTITTGDEAIDYDLQSILTHEVGHLFGLAHTDEQDAVMYPRHERGSTGRRRVKPDDAAGLCSAYPPKDAPTSCVGTPIGGFSQECGGGGGPASTVSPPGGCAVAPHSPRRSAPAPWLVAPVVVVAAGRRRRSERAC